MENKSKITNEDVLKAMMALPDKEQEYASKISVDDWRKSFDEIMWFLADKDDIYCLRHLQSELMYVAVRHDMLRSILSVKAAKKNE